MLLAITRAVPSTLESSELTHIPRTPIDVPLAIEEHRLYEHALTECGCRIVHAPAEPSLPDSVFVEDTAIILDEIAVITRPGAESRRPETASIAETVGAYRSLAFIEEPGTLDGGDVLRIGRRIFVGSSGRSNPEGIRQLSSILAPLGYSVTAAPLRDCLHLKSAVTLVAPDTLLLNPSWTDADFFQGVNRIEIDPGEPFAANALLVNHTVIYPSNHPLTAARLRARGIDLRLVPAGELAKAEGGVTCCCLLIEE